MMKRSTASGGSVSQALAISESAHVGKMTAEAGGMVTRIVTGKSAGVEMTMTARMIAETIVTITTGAIAAISIDEIAVTTAVTSVETTTRDESILGDTSIRSRPPKVCYVGCCHYHFSAS